MTALHSRFTDVHNNQKSVMEQTLDSALKTDIAEAYHFIEDLNLWLDTLKERRELSLLQSAVNEYIYGLDALVRGQYRYAFVAMRYFIEQICKFTYLSANELLWHHWRMGHNDVSWAALTHEQTGIFSPSFIIAFQPDLDRQFNDFRSITCKLYREMSEFIHGNHSKNSLVSHQLSFQEGPARMWLDASENVRLLCHFLLFIRFGGCLNKNSLCRLETSLLEELGGIPELRNLIEVVAHE